MCLTQHFSTFFVQGLANGFLYALIALGYTLVYGVLQLINFAHSEVFMLGRLRRAVRARPRGVGRSPTAPRRSVFVGLGVLAGGDGRRRSPRSCSNASPTGRCAGATRRSSPS